jgi:hypothetical protein
VSDTEKACFSGNAEKYFGPEFAKVLEKAPDATFLVEGSPVTVFKGVPLG